MSNPTDRHIAEKIASDHDLGPDSTLVSDIEQAIAEAKKGMYSEEDVLDILNSVNTDLLITDSDRKKWLTEYRKGRK